MDKHSKLLGLIKCLRRKKSVVNMAPGAYPQDLYVFMAYKCTSLVGPYISYEEKLDVVSAVPGIVLIIYFFVCSLQQDSTS